MNRFIGTIQYTYTLEDSGSSDLWGFELSDDVRTTPCQTAEVVLSERAGCLVFDDGALSPAPCQNADVVLSVSPGCFGLTALARAPGIDVDIDRDALVCCHRVS